MIFHKKHFVLSSIFYACLCMFLIAGSSATAADSQILTVEEIEKGAIDKLASTLPWDKESLEINVYYEGEDIVLPPGKKELVYNTRGTNQRAGRIPLILQVKVDDNLQKRIRLNSRVLVSQEVVKTIRPVRKGEMISNDNIQLETIQTERPWGNAISNIDHALGYAAGRNLPTGKILTQKFLKKPALANRGEKILILAEKGTMKITAPGILKEDGYADAMVRVLNIESKKIIYGRLVDANTVKVNF
ncbi:MAG: flagellar basal body P-ring formation protein FlgA [Nitrospina sp.]|jgi:flagellar basal body P-ring formation protein FlgA|nr:flagellar basal body P-ring formation protein FlgA [Nitrospina sp.]MBT3414868.1 flagellar basal body P-ring formation protein FlgA [Nitrospina sp.]MBT3857214.1 flagellar basal body P-ring formation protein FlgA [Nitrospina sp.]MBT4104427.1 flagellar basal body P-ring formation protein FlgA [Nitrospina sp.]MBT4375662.1 flagellar basal body P-ring formation protein FlgA [Nitrospina sp.]